MQGAPIGPTEDSNRIETSLPKANGVVIGDRVQCSPGGYGEVSWGNLTVDLLLCVSYLPQPRHCLQFFSFLTQQWSHPKQLHSTEWDCNSPTLLVIAGLEGTSFYRKRNRIFQTHFSHKWISISCGLLKFSHRGFKQVIVAPARSVICVNHRKFSFMFVI